MCSNRDVRSMFVVASCTGLVADRAFSRNEPVMYLSGRICLQNECIGREKPGTILPFVFLYRFFLSFYPENEIFFVTL